MNKLSVRTLALILVLALSLGNLAAIAAEPDAPIAIVPISAPVLGDTKGALCEAAVAELGRLGLVSGYPDGSFRPDNTITRAEIAKIFALAKTEPVTSDIVVKLSDIDGHWAEDYITRLVSLGLILGYPDGTFAPNKNISYRETAALCLRLIGYDESVLADLDAYAAKAAEYGIFDDIDAEPEAFATRGDTITMLYRAMALTIGKVEDGDFMVPAPGTCYLALHESAYILDNSDMLCYFTLCDYYEDGLINAAQVAADPDLYIWESNYAGFVPAAKLSDVTAIQYTFVAVTDTDGDGKGDAVFSVDRADASMLWDPNAQYSDPRAEDDERYADVYNREYMIPYGERIMGFADEDGFLDGAVYDYLNTVKAGDLDASTYWANYDWFNSTSNGSLTLLSGFKTTQQSTGWACGVTSALMAMDWFGLRDDLNELDLSALRNTKEKYGSYRFGGATDVKMLINVFDSLNDMYGETVWNYESTYDFADADGKLDDDYLSPDWILERLNAGRPILVGWNSFGAHWQVIIGYDSMGTDATADDVLILADPYDTTDHRNDGINIQSYQRLVYDWTQNFDRDFSVSKGCGAPVIFVPYPADPEFTFTAATGKGLAPASWSASKTSNMSDDMLIPYGETADDLDASSYDRAKAQRHEGNKLAGPASSRWFRKADVVNSPYYAGYDFFGGSNLPTDTLVLLEGFKTAQQAAEWSCGPASVRMVLEYFDLIADESEFSLAAMRENDREGATTLDGIVEIFDALNEKHEQGWTLITTDDLDDDLACDGYYLEGGAEDGLIPYFLNEGIPVLIGWNEWGGHWQVIIGYDDMGTEETQDDVLILADPYDTTDHNQDGYVIESYERLIYGWGARFDERGDYIFAAAIPESTGTAD